MMNAKVSYVPILGRKIRIAIVGCGRIFQKHLEAINDHSDDLEIVAVCDTNPERLREAEKLCGGQGFLNLSNMLANCELDLVCLCTPSGLHSEQTIEVAKHGMHVMTEKPMATKWKGGLAMVQACDIAESTYLL